MSTYFVLLIMSCCVLAVVSDTQEYPDLIYMGSIRHKTKEVPHGRSSGPTEDSEYPDLIYLGSISSKTAEGPKGRSSGPTKMDLDMKYYRSPERAGWKEAFDQCPKRTNGHGFLAEIDNDSEDAELHELVIGQPESKQLIGQRLWIGGVSDGNGELNWVPSGRKMPYTNFGIEPKGKSWISFISLSSRNFEWSPRRDEHEPNYYLCKIGPNLGHVPSQSTDNDNIEPHGGEGGELYTPGKYRIYDGDKWGEMTKCPAGEFVSSAWLLIQIYRQDYNNYNGVTDLRFECNGGKRILSEGLGSGTQTEIINCGGFFVGYKFRFVSEAEGAKQRDQRGITNMMLLCKEGGEENEMEMKLNCDDQYLDPKDKKRCIDEPNYGEWTEWIRCPEGQGISGFKTEIKKERDAIFNPLTSYPVDTAGITNVAFWCEPIANAVPVRPRSTQDAT